MKRRSNQEGTYRKRSAHSWEGSISIEGTRRYVYGSTKAVVRDKLIELQNEVNQGTHVDENEITVSDWMDTWIECYTAKVKDSTRDRYMQDIRCHIKPELGTFRIQDLKMLTVQKFLNHCKTKGLSEKSVKSIYLVLNKALTRAQKDGYIKKNPCTDAEIPSYDDPHKEMRPLKDHEIPAFLSAIKGHPFEYLFYIALFTGMRESELIGLSWDCIDWDHETIHLYRQLKRARGKGAPWVFTTLKNKQDRTFAVPHSVIAALQKIRLKQAEWKLSHGQLFQNTDNLVFTNELGEHLATHTVWKQFKQIVSQLGLPEVRFHDLRHSYATLALQNGVDIKTVSTNLGHATVAFTMDKYAHVSITMQKESAARMESFIASL